MKSNEINLCQMTDIDKLNKLHNKTRKAFLLQTAFTIASTLGIFGGVVFTATISIWAILIPSISLVAAVWSYNKQHILARMTDTIATQLKIVKNIKNEQEEFEKIFRIEPTKINEQFYQEKIDEKWKNIENNEFILNNYDKDGYFINDEDEMNK